NAFLDAVEGRPEQVMRIASLAQTFASGEALTAKQAGRFRRLLHEPNGTRLINLYGPTEATVDVTHFDCTAYEMLDTVPIGAPIANTRLYVVGAGDRLQPIGLAGELCIAGDGLARGYVNRPELTSEKFAPNPFEPGERMYRTGDLARWTESGQLEYLGRIDHQLKIRGNRIEPGEIEAALLKHEAVTEAIVTGVSDAAGMEALCAYYVASAEATAAELRDWISRSLPSYMLPTYFVRLSSMPLTASGKADRKALPKPQDGAMERAAYEAPVGQMEAELAELWRELLGAERIGRHNPFFEIGGHSLLLVRAHNELESRYPGALKLTDLFLYPTVSSLAEHLQAELVGDRAREAALLMLPPSYFAGARDAGQWQTFDAKLAVGKVEGLRAIAASAGTGLYPLLVASFLFVLSRHAGGEEISVQSGIPGGRLTNIAGHMSNPDDFAGLLASVASRLQDAAEDNGSFGYRLADLRRRAIPKGDRGVLALIAPQDGLEISPSGLHPFDMAALLRIRPHEVEFRFAYDGRRLRTTKLQSLIGDYLKFAAYLAAQADRRTAQPAVTREREEEIH
ncbi:AMP-binding protein, partial [Paenibacillus aurantiacus]